MAGGEAQLKYLDGDFDVIMLVYVIAVPASRLRLKICAIGVWRGKKLCRCDASMQAELDNAARS